MAETFTCEELLLRGGPQKHLWKHFLSYHLADVLILAVNLGMKLFRLMLEAYFCESREVYLFHVGLYLR